MTGLVLALAIGAQCPGPPPVALPAPPTAGIPFAIGGCVDEAVIGAVVIVDGTASPVRPVVVGPVAPDGLRYLQTLPEVTVAAGPHTLALQVVTVDGRRSAPSGPIAVTAVAPPPPAVCTTVPLVVTSSYVAPVPPGKAITVVARASEDWVRATVTRQPDGRVVLEVVDGRGCTATLRPK